MPAWNGERYLEAALQSVQAEGTRGYEIVAVDDGSTDRTPHILRTWADRLPLRILAHGGRGNWVAASNAALRGGRGRYACFLHQDDLWLPGRLAALEREVKDGPSLVVHPAGFIGPEAQRLGAWGRPLPEGDGDAALFAEPPPRQNLIALPPAPVHPRRRRRPG